MIARSGAGDVEQVALGVVDLLQVSIVSYRFDPLLQGNDLIIAQTLGFEVVGSLRVWGHSA